MGTARLQGDVRWQRGEPEWLDLQLGIEETDHEMIMALLPEELREQAHPVLLEARFPRVELQWTGAPVFEPEDGTPPPRLRAEAEFTDAAYAPEQGGPPLVHAAGRFSMRREDAGTPP